MQVADSNLTNIIGESELTFSVVVEVLSNFMPCATCQRTCNYCVTCTIEHYQLFSAGCLPYSKLRK
jgi:hypothetical protein